MNIQQQLIALVKEYESHERDDPKRGPLLMKLRLIGQTAAFFDGYDGMKRLHDAAEAIVGCDNSIGYTLNYVWDGIGGWWA